MFIKYVLKLVDACGKALLSNIKILNKNCEVEKIDSNTQFLTIRFFRYKKMFYS